MSKMTHQAVQKEIERLRKKLADSSSSELRVQAKALRESADRFQEDYLRRPLLEAAEEKERLAEEAVLPPYVEPVLKKLEEVYEEMEKWDVYTKGLRRGS